MRTVLAVVILASAAVCQQASSYTVDIERVISAGTGEKETHVTGTIDVLAWPPGLDVNDGVVALMDGSSGFVVLSSSQDVKDTAAGVAFGGVIPWVEAGSYTLIVGAWVWWDPTMMFPPMAMAWFFQVMVA